VRVRLKNVKDEPYKRWSIGERDITPCGGWWKMSTDRNFPEGTCTNQSNLISFKPGKNVGLDKVK